MHQNQQVSIFLRKVLFIFFFSGDAKHLYILNINQIIFENMKNHFVFHMKQLKYSTLENQVRCDSDHTRKSLLIQFVCPGGGNQAQTLLHGSTPGIVAQYPAASADQVWQDPQEGGGESDGETRGVWAVYEMWSVCPPSLPAPCSSSSHWRGTDLPSVVSSHRHLTRQ